MRRFVWTLCLAMLFVGCVSRKSADQMQREIDSLQQQVAVKEAMIDDVFSSISVITENLGKIKEREGLLLLAEQEMTDDSQLSRLNRDIESIDRLLAENRARIAELERVAAELKQANKRIRGLEKLINGLQEQVSTQQNEIGELRSRLTAAKGEVERLAEEVNEKNEEVDRLSEVNVRLEGDVVKRTTELHTIHYLIAPEKQLISDQVICKRGFIGRTPVVTENPNLALFVEGDARLIKQLPIGKRNVELITSHPEESFWLVESQTRKGEIESLVILDSEKFWSLSKILVISHK